MDRDDLLVAAQAAGLLGVLAPGRPRWGLPLAVTLGAGAAVASGGALTVAAAAQHGRLLTPRVRPPVGAPLLRTGAYRWSRNPIYAGLLLASGGVALLRRRPGPLVAFAVLAAALRLKIAREESWLSQRFGQEYRDYRRDTPRLLGRPR